MLVPVGGKPMESHSFEPIYDRFLLPSVFQRPVPRSARRSSLVVPEDRFARFDFCIVSILSCVILNLETMNKEVAERKFRRFIRRFRGFKLFFEIDLWIFIDVEAMKRKKERKLFEKF